jgi:hypothetical protein
MCVTFSIFDFSFFLLDSVFRWQSIKKDAGYTLLNAIVTLLSQQVEQLQNAGLATASTLAMHASLLAAMTSISSSNLAGTVASLLVDNAALQSTVATLQEHAVAVDGTLSATTTKLNNVTADVAAIQTKFSTLFASGFFSGDVSGCCVSLNATVMQQAAVCRASATKK